MPGRAAGYPVEIRGAGTKKHRQWVADSQKRLLAGKRFRQVEREDRWVASEEQYEGRQWPTKADGSPAGDLSDFIVINMSFSTVNTIVPYMTGSEPNFLVVPYGEGATEQNAAIQQAFLNRIWRGELEGQAELESTAVDYLIYGDGYLKIGYDIIEKRVNANEYVDAVSLWVERVNPWDIWIDPHADGIHNARWVAHRFRMTEHEVEAAGFKVTDAQAVNYARYHAGDPESTGENSQREAAYDMAEYVTIYEFYDLVENYSITFTLEGNAPMAVIEDIPVCPIVQMPNYRIPNMPYHMGELEQLRDIQHELNFTRTQMLQHRARNAQKFVYAHGALDEAGLQALESNAVNVGIPVKTNGGPLDQFFTAVNVPNLSADAYNMSDLLQRDIYEISGVNEYLRGATPTIRRTATEATIIEGASNAKSSFKLRTIERAVKRVGTILLGFAADTYPETDYEELDLYLTGRDAQLVARATPPAELVNDLGEQITPDQVASTTINPAAPGVWVGTYEVLVEQASTELRSPIIREQKFKDMAFELIQFQPALAEQGIRLDLRKILTLWFEAAGIDDVDGMFIEAGPDQINLGRADVELFGDLTNPDIIGQLEQLGLGQLAGSPDEIVQTPPDVLNGGEFNAENTGILPTSEGEPSRS